MPDNPHQFCEGRVLRCDAVDVIDHMRAVNGVKTVVWRKATHKHRHSRILSAWMNPRVRTAPFEARVNEKSTPV